MLSEIEIEVIKALSEILADTIKEDSEINLDVSLVELGLNSISYIKLIVILEIKFDFEFEDEDFDYTKFTTVRDISAYLETKLQSL